MNIISSTNVDLIEPFPVSEARRVFTWLHIYRNIIESDLSPKTPDEFEAFLREVVATPGVRSFGLIDKANKLNFRHEAPLIGMIVFEPSGGWNCYCHIASPRRAWGMGFMDEGVRAALDYLFATSPSLLRVSAMVLDNNGPVKGFIRRLGCRYEGRLRDMLLQNGVPKDVLHFCITRNDWLERQSKEKAKQNEGNEPSELSDSSDSVVSSMFLNTPSTLLNNSVPTITQ